jgi:hypothetical protein
MLSSYTDQFSNRSVPAFSLSENLKPVLSKKSIEVQVEGAYQPSRKFQSVAFLKSDSTAFYGNPDFQYLLDNYTRFVTMDEVIKEYVTGVRARKNADGYNLRVFNSDTKNFFETDPLLLIDGLPIFKPDKIMAFDPLKIRKIEIISRKYFLGNFEYDGIVSFKTYEGNLAGYELDPAAMVVDFDGLQQQREFYMPQYEKNTPADNRLPDLRNQLNWIPDIKTTTGNKSSFSFWTSDLTGKFIIVVQGITKNGLAGSKIILLEVKAP